MAKRHPEPGDISTTYLLCRSLGHAWAPELVVVRRRDDPNAMFHVGRLDSWYEATYRCTRGPLVRHEVVGRTNAMLLAHRYEYPEGYLLKGIGDRKAWNREVRGEVLDRLSHEPTPRAVR